MGLWDRKRRTSAELPEHYVELVRRTGKNEAEVERLGLIWEAYRDELKRLVARLEKRDQRAQVKAEADCVDCPEPAQLDLVSQRILNRRNRRNGLQNVVSRGEG